MSEPILCEPKCGWCGNMENLEECVECAAFMCADHSEDTVAGVVCPDCQADNPEEE